jgi:hypothetical protein
MMGDLVCTSAQCTTGADSVTAMDNYFQALDPASQAAFKTRHDAIMEQFNAAYSWYSPYIPFNPACCDVLTIGKAADGLLCQMEGGQGCVSPSSGDGSMSLQGMIVLAAVGFLAFTYMVNRR